MATGSGLTATATGAWLPNDDVAELSLLLPRDQIVRLVEAATNQGVSVAQFLRRLIQRALAERDLARASLN